MTSTSIDVVGVGNAIVDVIAKSSDEFVASQGLVKGSMSLIDNTRAHELYALLEHRVEASGGSVANTMAGIASFGGSAAYIGKVADDSLGKVFAEDMRAIGVGFDTPATPISKSGEATGRSMILVTPDAQRTMNTYLGISNRLEPSDVSREMVASAKILFCEGYLWDVESAKAAIRTAMKMAADAGRRSALTLSDGFCVDRHREEFHQLIVSSVDILFANEDELTALYSTTDFDFAVESVAADSALSFVTMGSKGSLVVRPDSVIEIAPVAVKELVDTTGAGDQYAAGVLYGLANGFDLAEAGHLGSLAAAEVIGHVGPRPLLSLRELADL